MSTVAVIGGGPAGLMAAEMLAQGGVQVDLYDAMPSVGRKFLLAGVGGMNITHSEPFDAFLSRYGTRAASNPSLARSLPSRCAARMDSWAGDRDLRRFIGTRVSQGHEGRAAAARMAAPAARSRGAVSCAPSLAGVGRLRRVALRCTLAGEQIVQADAVVLALGGGSWAKLGSDGAWVPLLAQRGVAVAPLLPSNCGFDVAGGWSEHLRSRFAGQPLKTVALRFTDAAGHIA